MTKRILAITAVILFAITAAAQTVPPHNTLTATIKDAGGRPYSKAFYTVQLVDSAGRAIPGTTRATYQGQPVSPTLYSGNLDTTGTFTISVVPNNAVGLFPQTTQWQINISAPNSMYLYNDARAWSIQYATVITADTNLSTQLSALAQPVSYVDVNGPSAFLQPVYGVTPTDPKQLATKAYVDAAAGAGNIPSPQFSLFYQPTPGTSSTAQGDPNITTDGTGNATAVSLKAKAVGGSYYAGQWQTGGGNNGIATAFANTTLCGAAGSGGVGGCVVVAGPTYPVTEQPYTSNGKSTFPSPSNTLFYDQRQGTNLRISHDPPISTYANSQTSFADACVQTSLSPDWPGGIVWNSQPQYCHAYVSRFSNPGLNLGTTTYQPGGWSVQVGLNIDQVVNSPGISEALAISDVKAGVGDHTNYIYHYNYGGAIAGSDEGSHQLSLGGGEAPDTYLGTIATGGTGATSIKINCTEDCQNPGDGRFDINLSKGVTGNVTAHTTPSGQTPGTFTTDIAVTPSTAWGTLNANVLTPDGTPKGVGTTPMTFVVNSGPGNTGQFAANDLVCFTGNFHEQARVTSVTGTGPWTLTVPLRQTHEGGSWIMANGPCTDYINFTANNATSGVSTTLHYPSEIIGATDAHTLVYRYFRLTGEQILNSGLVLWPQVVNGTWSNTAGVVTIPTLKDITGSQYYIGIPTITISGASDSTFNGICTSTVSSGLPNNQIKCSQAASTGHSFTGTATISIGSTGYGNTAFTLYPGAQLLDMQDYNAATCTAAGLTAPCNDGTHTLEANNVVWGVGDSIENSHHYAALQGTIRNYFNNYNPMAIATGRVQIIRGVTGALPTNFTANYSGDFIANDTPATNYLYHGGIQTPPGGYTLGQYSGNTGLFNYGLMMEYAPDPIGSSALIVGCPLTGCNDPNYWYYVFSTYPCTNCINNGLKFTPSTNAFQLTGWFDSALLRTPTVTSIANGTAASMEFDSLDGGAVKHAYTISAPTAGGPYTQTLPQKTGTFAMTSDLGTTVVSQASMQVQAGSAPVVIGDQTNLVVNSTALTSGSWSNIGNANWVFTGSQADPFGGTTAVKLDKPLSGSYFGWGNSVIATASTTYCVSGYMKGAVGGEQIYLDYGDQASPLFTLTTSWARYSSTINTSTGTQFGFAFAAFSLGAASSLYAAAPQVTLGSCPSPISAYLPTGAAAVTSPLSGVWTPTIFSPTGRIVTIDAIALLASPGLTGTPTAPTQAAGDTSTDIATDAFVYASTSKAVTCGTTTTCGNTAQASPRIVHGNVALTAGSAVVASMTAWTATTSFDCTGTDKTAAAAVQIVNTSTTSITITGTGTDVVAYVCVGN